MGKFLNPDDFPDLEGAATLIEDAEALAMLVAPCLGDDDLSEIKTAQARAILRGAVLRWNDAGSGATQQQSAGPFSQTITTQARRNSFWPSEIKDLQLVCRVAGSGKAYSVDTAPSLGNGHALICSINFGAVYCSCAADITGGAGPLYEVD
ncbi:MAG: hypothetical protein EOP24_32075 [Hyphomicrobiales bacterium]|nr:MAG: hypothetical protein EOP24_32075 [Hyphomicrobiales bacterium]